MTKKVTAASPVKAAGRSGKGAKAARSAVAGNGPERAVVVVLGMHRSGTSMLAGILSRLGCDAGKTLMPGNFANEKGYYESLPIARLNDRILESAGTSWQDWQAVNPGWFSSVTAEKFRREATEVMEAEFGDSRLLVLKDPRICRLLPFWRDVFDELGVSPGIIHIHRNPIEVAASLKARDGVSLGYGYLLWLRHTLDAERASRGMARFFTSFERLIANWAGVTEAAAADLGVSWPRLSARVISEVEEFVAPDLKHFNVTTDHLQQNVLVPSWVKETFQIFGRWSEGDRLPGDTKILDALQRELDQSATVFARLLDEGMQMATSLKKEEVAGERIRTELQNARTRSSDLEKELAQTEARAKEAYAAADAERQALETGKAGAEARLQELSESLSQTQARAEEASRRAAELEAGSARLSSELAQRRAESDHWAQSVEAMSQDLDGQRKDSAARLIEAEYWASRVLKCETDIARLEFQREIDRHSFDREIATLIEGHRLAMDRLRKEFGQLGRKTQVSANGE